MSAELCPKQEVKGLNLAEGAHSFLGRQRLGVELATLRQVLLRALLDSEHPRLHRIHVDAGRALGRDHDRGGDRQVAECRLLNWRR